MGNKYMQRLAIDLKDYGKGYSNMQFKNMAQFASIFEEVEIGRQPVAHIPWNTIIKIMQKSSSKEEML